MQRLLPLVRGVRGYTVMAGVGVGVAQQDRVVAGRVMAAARAALTPPRRGLIQAAEAAGQKPTLQVPLVARAIAS